MERLDQELAAAMTDAVPMMATGRVLFIECDEGVCGTLTTFLTDRSAAVCASTTIDDADTHFAREHWDVIILGCRVETTATHDMIRSLHTRSPHGRAVVLAEEDSADAVIEALRAGAADYIKLPVSDADLTGQVERALVKAVADRDRDERFVRLKRICRDLNDARHDVSRQLDLLCQDLVNAYQELSDQMGEVAMATEFRTLMRQELDVEELLRTMLEYLLTKTGPTNAAVFLPDHEGHFNLGAYVNYDCPRDSVTVLLDRLCDVICPALADESDIVSFEDADEFSAWIGEGAQFLSDSHVIAYACRDEEDCMAVVVLYRNATMPFDESLANTIDTMRTIFAEQLKRVIRIHHRAQPEWPADSDQTLGFDEYDDDLDDFDLAA